MSFIVRIKSATYQGKHCYLYEHPKHGMGRHTNFASLFGSRASAIRAIELMRIDIMNNVINGDNNLDERLRYAEVIHHANCIDRKTVFFEPRDVESHSV